MPSENDETNAAKPTYNLRKRAKVTTSAATAVDQEDQEDPQDDEYDDPGEAYTSKRAPSGATTTTRKRKRAPRGGDAPEGLRNQAEIQTQGVEDTSGGLEKMLLLPLDLIYEILGHATPIDLLTLTRTSKSFRHLLMNCSAKSVWLDAWRNDVHLPQCPDDMTPPAFVELLYDSWCHRCFTSQGQVHWFWSARARYCSQCGQYLSSKMELTWDDIEYGFDPKSYPLSNLLPTIGFSSFRLEDVSEFVQAWKQVPKSQREEFLEMRERIMDERQMHAQRCHKWQRRVNDQKLEDERLSQLRRIESITERLKEIGWAKVLDDMTAYQQKEFLALPDIRKKRNLTNRVISNMLPRLVTWLQACQEVQERPLRMKAIKDRIEQLDNVLLPISADHNISPSIRDIVVDMPEARQAIDVALDATVSFDALLAALPAFTEQWRQEAYTSLDQQIRQRAYNLKELKGDPLVLAVGEFFRCEDCLSPVSHTDILNHHCPRQNGKFNRTVRSHHFGSYDEAAQRFCSSISAFPTERQRFLSCAWATLQIVSLCGETPETATSEEMDTSDSRLVCSRCSTGRRRMVLTWRAAARHSIGSHTLLVHGLFERATAVEAEAAKMQEGVVFQNYAAERQIHCGHCPRDERRVDYKIDDLFEHLKTRHGIEEPSELDGFYDATLPPICQDPVYLDVAEPAVE